MKKLTKVQKTTRFIVYTVRNILLLGLISGIIPAIMCGLLNNLLGL